MLLTYYGSLLSRSLREPCSGFCLTHPGKDEIIHCEDGERLRMYWCFHDQCYVLTNYIPAQQ